MKRNNQLVTLAEQERMGLRRPQPANFVPALREPERPRIEILPAEPIQFDVTQSATQHLELRTSATDRAKGFSVVTGQLSGMLGILAVIAAVAGWGHPLASLFTLGAFFSAYCLTWCAAWVIYNLFSVEGVSLIESLLKWKFLFREQAYRQGVRRNEHRH